MFSRIQRLTIFIFVFMFSSSLLAQSTCDELLSIALDSVLNNCSSPFINSVCYGNNLIIAQAQSDASVTFEDLGDVVYISDLETIVHSPFSESSELWGVSLLSLRANIPDSIPGQVVQIIIFGDVEMGNVQQNAFSLRSGIGQAACGEVPDSGIMVQTPEGIAEVTLNINDVDITLRSTAFIEANLLDGMTVTMLEGSADVNAFGETQTVTFANASNIPLAADGFDLIPSAPPSAPETWNTEKVAKLLPISSVLSSIGTDASETDQSNASVSSAPCTVTAPNAEALVRVGPGENRSSFTYLDSDQSITVTGKKLVDDVVWWQLNKSEVSERAVQVLELWVEEATVEEAGDCNAVPDVDAPPIIAAPVDPTAVPEALTAVTGTEIVPTVAGDIPSVQPQVNIVVGSRNLQVGECTGITATIHLYSTAAIGGAGIIDDNTIEGAPWVTRICPPSSPGEYIYTINIFSLTNELTQEFINISVSDGT